MQQGPPSNWEPPPAPWVPPEPAPLMAPKTQRRIRTVAISLAGLAVAAVGVLVVVAVQPPPRPPARYAVNATDLAAEIFADRAWHYPGKRVAIYGYVSRVDATRWGPRVFFTTRRTTVSAYLRRGEPVPAVSKTKRYAVNCLAAKQSDGFVFDDCFGVE